MKVRVCWMIVGFFICMAVWSAATGHAWETLFDCLVVAIWVHNATEAEQPS